MPSIKQTILLCLIVTINGYAVANGWSTQTLSHQGITPSFRASEVTDGVIWVGGTHSSIFRSDNGGESYQNVSLNLIDKTIEGDLDIRDIHAFDKLTAIAMTAGEGDLTRLYKTVDGGHKWTLLLKNYPQGTFYDSIDFWDDQNGILMGDPVDGYFVILLTKDGGQSWQRVAKAQIPVMTNQEIAFAASGNTVITGSNGQAWFVTGGFSAHVLQSDDFGNTWVRKTAPLYSKTKYAGAYGLSINKKNEVFVVGGDFEERGKQYSNMAKKVNLTLINGNKTHAWQQVSNGQHGLRTAMACTDKVCIASGKLSSDISFDQGATWQLMEGPGFYTLASENDVIVAAGHDGRVGLLVDK
jgi:photosystem II stability/assembly factor-like uncharacterized protein